MGILIPCYTEGDNKECKSFRSISLLANDIRKNSWKKTKTEDYELVDLGKERGPRSNIYLEATDTYITFIYIEKAFDCLRRVLMWKSLGQRGVNWEMPCPTHICISNYVRTK